MQLAQGQNVRKPQIETPSAHLKAVRGEALKGEFMAEKICFFSKYLVRISERSHNRNWNAHTIENFKFSNGGLKASILIII